MTRQKGGRPQPTAGSHQGPYKCTNFVNWASSQLITLYKFQVYNSITYIAFELTTQSLVSLHHHVFDPFTLFTFPRSPSSLITFTLLSTSTNLFICCFLFYISPSTDIMWFLSFSIWLVLLSTIISRFIHILANGSIHPFVWLSQFHEVSSMCWPL